MVFAAQEHHHVKPSSTPKKRMELPDHDVFPRTNYLVGGINLLFFAQKNQEDKRTRCWA